MLTAILRPASLALVLMLRLVKAAARSSTMIWSSVDERRNCGPQKQESLRFGNAVAFHSRAKIWGAGRGLVNAVSGTVIILGSSLFPSGPQTSRRRRGDARAKPILPSRAVARTKFLSEALTNPEHLAVLLPGLGAKSNVAWSYRFPTVVWSRGKSRSVVGVAIKETLENPIT
jgi:hypothetical protein